MNPKYSSLWWNPNRNITTGRTQQFFKWHDMNTNSNHSFWSLKTTSLNTLVSLSPSIGPQIKKPSSGFRRIKDGFENHFGIKGLGPWNQCLGLSSLVGEYKQRWLWKFWITDVLLDQADNIMRALHPTKWARIHTICQSFREIWGSRWSVNGLNWFWHRLGWTECHEP